MVAATPFPEESVPLAEVYSNFADGRWAHDSDDALRLQLLGEGRKRLDAFVFEHGFERGFRRVAKANDLSLAFGWHIGYDRRNRAYWIRLVDEASAWTLVDDELLERLLDREDSPPDVIVRCRFDSTSNTFLAQRFAAQGWGPYREARSFFTETTGQAPRPIREMSGSSVAHAGPALAYLFQLLTVEERRALSVRRRFVNGLLSPLLGRDPTDLDAVALSLEGRLTYIELKRKYPATGRHRYFGVDELPHVHTMNVLLSMNIRTLHIILVAPHWNDRESPVGWLKEKSLHSHWTWLVAWLSDKAFEDGINMATSGYKSGQRDLNRIQRAIKWDQVRLLSRGLQLSDEGRRNLASLLRWEEPPLAETSYELLDGYKPR